MSCPDDGVERDITFPAAVVSNKARDEVASLLQQLVLGAVARGSKRCASTHNQQIGSRRLSRGTLDCPMQLSVRLQPHPQLR